MNNTPITSCTHFRTAEGTRLSATYSEISDEGKLLRSNVRFDIIVVDQEIQDCIEKINAFMVNHIPNK